MSKRQMVYANFCSLGLSFAKRGHLLPSVGGTGFALLVVGVGCLKGAFVMKRLMLAIPLFLGSLAVQANQNLNEQAEKAIVEFTGTSDLYVYGDRGLFQEPCSGEVEADNKVFRFTVIKLSTQRQLDIEFDKVTGEMDRGVVAKFTSVRPSKRKLELRFNLEAGEKIRKGVLEIEKRGEDKAGNPITKISLKVGDVKLSCQGVEN
jgi:hypothetical protein